MLLSHLRRRHVLLRYRCRLLLLVRRHHRRLLLLRRRRRRRRRHRQIELVSVTYFHDHELVVILAAERSQVLFVVREGETLDQHLVHFETVLQFQAIEVPDNDVGLHKS